MKRQHHSSSEISADLLEAIRSFPLERVVEHCGTHFTVSPFDTYAHCPHCGARMKVRSYSAAGEIEDIFDAVFESLSRSRNDP